MNIIILSISLLLLCSCNGDEWEAPGTRGNSDWGREVIDADTRRRKRRHLTRRNDSDDVAAAQQYMKKLRGEEFNDPD